MWTSTEKRLSVKLKVVYEYTIMLVYQNRPQSTLSGNHIFISFNKYFSVQFRQTDGLFNCFRGSKRGAHEKRLRNTDIE